MKWNIVNDKRLNPIESGPIADKGRNWILSFVCGPLQFFAFCSSLPYLRFLFPVKGKLHEERQTHLGNTSEFNNKNPEKKRAKWNFFWYNKGNHQKGVDIL
ncbi:MAG: hypothetical protein HFE39_05665 [Clostridiales bacterium]|nr:hypothetical protein [Clostridiales bacterium]